MPSVILQSKYPTAPLPEGWTCPGMFVSGGHYLWGKGDTPEQVLSASILDIQERHRLKPMGEPGDWHVPDLETPLPFNELAAFPRSDRARYLQAVNLRIGVAKMANRDKRIGLYMPAASVQLVPSATTQHWHGIFLGLAEQGILRAVDGLFFNCYARRFPSEPGWEKQKHQILTTREYGVALRRATGNESLQLICTLAFRRNGADETENVPVEALAEQMQWAKDAGFDDVVIYNGDETLAGGVTVQEQAGKVSLQGSRS